MEQHFRTEMTDYFDFNVFIAKRNAPILLNYGFLFLLMMLPGLIFLLVSRPSPLALLAELAGIVLFNIGVIVALISSIVVYSTKRRPGAIGSFKTSIAPDIFVESSSMIETHIHWEKFSGITQSPRLLIFLISPTAGYIIPKRAFRDAEDAQRFLETAQAYQRAR